MAGKAEYKNQWQKENCDRVNLTLPKGRKVELQSYAAAAGESLNGFIAAIGALVSPDTQVAAQRAAEATGETVAAFLSRAVNIQAQRDKSSLAMGINPATGEKLDKEG